VVELNGVFHDYDVTGLDLGSAVFFILKTDFFVRADISNRYQSFYFLCRFIPADIKDVRFFYLTKWYRKGPFARLFLLLHHAQFVSVVPVVQNKVIGAYALSLCSIVQTDENEHDSC
jgi:hypothetical protein